MTQTDGKIRCFHINPTTGELISIVRGESGYYPYLDPHKLTAIKGEEAVEKMKQANTELGLTDEQVEAMFAGSLFGWNCPGAQAAWSIQNSGETFYEKFSREHPEAMEQARKENDEES